VPCGLQRLFHITIPGSMAMGLMLLTADLKSGAYSTQIFRSRQVYSHMMSSQLFEVRYCAWLALVLLAASWLVLLFKKQDPMPWAKILFAAALGPLTFGWMRLFLFGVYSDNLVWFDIWEEYTEFVFIIGIALALWVFRRSLLQFTPAEEARIGSLVR
jgi:hypothetical protein